MEEQRETMGLQEESRPTQAGRGRRAGLGTGILLGALGTVLLSVTAICLICFFTGSRILITPRAASDNADSTVLNTQALTKISELNAYIEAYYYEDVDADALRDGMYAGLVEGLKDRYSGYYTATQYQQSRVDMTGKYYGIGAGLRQDENTMEVSISRVYEGTPSETAGLMEEDIILSVDSVEANSMELSDLVLLIRGEEGTTVHLEVYRAMTNEYLSFDVERANVTLPSVASEMLTDMIGYIQIESFETDTAVQFESALAELENQGMRSLVVDLRYNGGGLVDSVVQILDDILPEGLLVYTEDKYGNRQEYRSSGETHFDYPLVVLVNEDSASASEIFAGAIKDYSYGTLIGTTTFGKGIVQSVIPLADGDAIKLTTAKYFTPNGSYIHGVGIQPDIELEYEYLNPEGEVYEMQYDNQIQKAIELLSEEP